MLLHAPRFAGSIQCARTSGSTTVCVTWCAGRRLHVAAAAGRVCGARPRGGRHPAGQQEEVEGGHCFTQPKLSCEAAGHGLVLLRGEVCPSQGHCIRHANATVAHTLKGVMHSLQGSALVVMSTRAAAAAAATTSHGDPANPLLVVPFLKVWCCQHLSLVVAVKSGSDECAALVACRWSLAVVAAMSRHPARNIYNTC